MQSTRGVASNSVILTQPLECERWPGAEFPKDKKLLCLVGRYMSSLWVCFRRGYCTGFFLVDNENSGHFSLRPPWRRSLLWSMVVGCGCHIVYRHSHCLWAIFVVVIPRRCWVVDGSFVAPCVVCFAITSGGFVQGLTTDMGSLEPGTVLLLVADWYVKNIL